ncbi:RDD family protein [Dyella japonica]|uniref:Transporter n=1 Tax=Dyella japonica A8 TaxID=1217721 RepID=A0A075K5B7_9GAMM|nr:RDD family protein [Dyella japonica]AIF49305.1 transporter [Dyella japonica A8]
MSSTAATDVYCPLWRRLAALVYDLLAVVAIVMVVGYVCQRVTGGTVVTTDGHAHIAWWYQPLQAVVVSAYFLASWLRGGQTLGMRPWRIRVTNADGQRITPLQAVIRLAVAAAPMLLLGLATWMGPRGAAWAMLIAWIAWFGVAAADSRKRALHDLVAGTELRRMA